MNLDKLDNAFHACTEFDMKLKVYEVRALLCIYKSPGILQSKLGRVLGIHPSSVVRMIAILNDAPYKTQTRQRLGLITLHNSDGDRRNKGMSLTSKGAALVSLIEQAVEAGG